MLGALCAALSPEPASECWRVLTPPRRHGSSGRARLSETSSAAAWRGAPLPGPRRPASPICSLEPDHAHRPPALSEAAAAPASPFSPALPPPGSGLQVDAEHPALQASPLPGSVDETPPETPAEYARLHGPPRPPPRAKPNQPSSPRGRHIPDAAPQPLLHKGRPLNVKSQAWLLKSLLSPATWGRKLLPSRPNPTAACPQAQRGHRGLQQRPLLYVRVTHSTGTLQNPGPSVPAVSHRGQGTESTHRRSEHGMLGASLPWFPQLGEPEHSPWSCEEADPSRSGGEGRSAAPQLLLNKTTGSDETTSHR